MDDFRELAVAVCNAVKQNPAIKPDEATAAAWKEVYDEEPLEFTRDGTPGEQAEESRQQNVRSIAWDMAEDVGFDASRL